MDYFDSKRIKEIKKVSCNFFYHLNVKIKKKVKEAACIINKLNYKKILLFLLI